MQIAARIISILFVPPTFTLIVYVFLAFFLETETLKSCIIVFVSLIFGFAAPIILFLKFRTKGKIIDQDASVKEERTKPLLISAAFYVAGLVPLIEFNVHIISMAFWFCYISNTLVLILINRHWKISVHAMGASGPLAAITYVIGAPALIFGITVFLVGWSRIILKVHSVNQVAAGIIFAFISTYLQIYLIVRLFE